MINLNEISVLDLSKRIINKEKIAIEVPHGSIEGLEHVIDLSNGRPQEIPPSPVALSAETIARIISKKEISANDKLMYTVIVAAILGGRILYSPDQPGEFIATIEWE